MSKVWKIGGVWLAIATVVWLMSIWRWQSAGQDVGTGELVTHLLLLPTVLAAILLAGVWGIQRLRRRPVGSMPAAASGRPDAVSPDGLADASVRRAHAWVLGEATSLTLGPDAETAWSTLCAGSVRPELDPTLRDLDGLPVFCARVPDLDLAAWQDPLAPHSDDAEPTSVSVQRALALLQGPLQQMLDIISAQTAASDGAGRAGGPERTSAPELDMKAHLSGVATPHADTASVLRSAQAPVLTLRLLWPAEWREDERQQATDWARRQCGELLDWAHRVGAQGLNWVHDPLSDPEHWWGEVDQILSRWGRDLRPELLLVLAVDSAAHEAAVTTWQARGELFTAAHQSGRIPGEGAAALLLAHPRWLAWTGQEHTVPKLYRPVRARRDKSADAAGRIGCQALQGALEQVVAVTNVAPAAWQVVSDGDHRASRTAEVFEALQAVLPELDPMQQVARLGAACGELGMARAVAPTALAAAAVRGGLADGVAAVAAHVQSPYERVVVTVTAAEPEALAA